MVIITFQFVLTSRVFSSKPSSVWWKPWDEGSACMLSILLLLCDCKMVYPFDWDSSILYFNYMYFGECQCWWTLVPDAKLSLGLQSTTADALCLGTLNFYVFNTKKDAVTYHDSSWIILQKRILVFCYLLFALPGTWSHLWFAGVLECPPWCYIVGATVTVHQFFCILHCYISYNQIVNHESSVIYAPVPNLSHLFSHVNHTCFNPEIFTCDHSRILTCKLGWNCAKFGGLKNSHLKISGLKFSHLNRPDIFQT